MRGRFRKSVFAFLLNACQSYEQGHELVKKGSQGGVVTLSPVGNPMATELGQMLARLLNRGFTLRTALSIAQRHAVHGYQYTVLGDGGISLLQNEKGNPRYAKIERINENRFEVEISVCMTYLFGLGTHINFHHDWSQERYLGSAPVTTLTLDAEPLQTELSKQVVPVEMDGELRWSNKIRPCDWE